MAGNWLARIRSKGSAPQGFQDMVLQPSNANQYFYQEKQNYIWGNGRSNELRSALTNFWVGNYAGLPPSINFIPGVAKSRFYWNVPTAYANALQKQQQYSRGFNTSGMSAVQNADLLQQVQAAWTARGGG